MRVLLYCILALLPFFGFAQRFTASVQRTNSPMHVQVTFLLENARAENFIPPGFKPLKVYSGPSRGESTSWVNGKTTSKFTWTYILEAPKAGKYNIPAARVEIGNESLATEPLTVSISTKDQQKAAEQKKNDPASSLGERVFVRVLLDKSNVYLGEQVNATIKLYVQHNLVDLQASKVSTFEGFWKHERDINAANQKFKQETYNGKQYNTFVLQKVALFPQRTGKLKINSGTYSTVVRLAAQNNRRSRGSIFDDFFMNATRYRDVAFETAPHNLSINVKSLPGNKPKDFSGLVGQFDLESSLTPNTVETDEAITLQLKIKGTGNIMKGDLKAPILPPNFEVFDPKVRDNVSKSSTKINGSKTYDYLLIPRTPGTFNLKPQTLSYFDPNTKSYKQLKTPAYEITVTGEASQEVVSNQFTNNQGGVEVLDDDIRYLQSNLGQSASNGEPATQSWWFWLLLVVPIVGGLSSIFVTKAMRLSLENSAIVKQSKAYNKSKAALTDLKLQQTEIEPTAFYKNLLDNLSNYLSDKTQIPLGDLSKETVGRKLEDLGVASETIQRVLLLYNQCEMAIFAPNAVVGGQDEVYQNTVNIIDQIESEL